jgi:hypothetical protein
VRNAVIQFLGPVHSGQSSKLCACLSTGWRVINRT